MKGILVYLTHLDVSDTINIMSSGLLAQVSLGMPRVSVLVSRFSFSFSFLFETVFNLLRFTFVLFPNFDLYYHYYFADILRQAELVCAEYPVLGHWFHR
jgi:hypothetical protein